MQRVTGAAAAILAGSLCPSYSGSLLEPLESGGQLLSHFSRPKFQQNVLGPPERTLPVVSEQTSWRTSTSSTGSWYSLTSAQGPGEDSTETPESLVKHLAYEFLRGSNEAFEAIAGLRENEKQRKELDSAIFKTLPVAIAEFHDVSKENFIGEGAHGRVFKGEQPVAFDAKEFGGPPDLLELLGFSRLGQQPVAFKAVQFSSPLALFELRGFSRLATTDSPYLCESRGVFRTADNSYLLLAMPVYGQDLHSVWTKRQKVGRGNFSCCEILELARQMTEAVQACHKRGFVHRDIKPDNFVCQKGSDISKIRLLDFAFATHRTSGLTVVAGTPAFAAPEVFPCSWNKGSYDHRVDIFSLGLSIATIAQLKMPSNLKVQLGHRGSPYSFIFPYPKKFRLLLQSMMDKNPDKRPSLEKVLKCIQGLQTEQAAANKEGMASKNRTAG